MHSYNFDGSTPTNKFIIVLPFHLKNRFDLIDRYFAKPFIANGGSINDLTIIFLSPTDTKNAKYYEKQEGLLNKILEVTKTKFVYVTDGALFTKLTKQKNPTKYYGLPVKGTINLTTLFFMGVNPEVVLTSDKNFQALNKSLNVFNSAIKTPLQEFKPVTLKSTQFVFSSEDALEKLREYFKCPIIACDIETKDLIHTRTGIETIGFAKSPHEGFAIAVDRNPDPEERATIRHYLKRFFEAYKGKIIWHGGKFDRKIITNDLYSLNDSPMYDRGREQHEDTMLMAYCIFNSVEKPSYSLKDHAFEFFGDYGLDVTDTTQIEINELLDYNIHDCCGTFYIHEKYLPMLIAENQEQIYREVFLPSLDTLIKTELCGIPVCPKATKEFIALLHKDQKAGLEALQQLATIEKFTLKLQQQMCDKKNETLKKKQVTIDDFSHIEYNPGSSKQTAQLLYNYLGLPVLSRTKAGAASTDKDTLELLLNHVKPGTEEEQIVKALNDLSKCKTLVATFIPILEEAITTNLRNGIGYIYGSFKIPGTISGRLASSDPNLQNMPSTGTKYAKAFKRCLIAPEGYVIVGIDFDSLEDRIAAKTTQDPNKLAVYLQGFDGHSLRAYYYYPDQIPRTEETPENINEISKTHPELRQNSKPITFALTYLGTASTLVKNCGLSLKEAEEIEARYHELYKVADAYVARKIEKAAEEGYVTGAFGFKLRAEILKYVVLNDKKTPHKIQKITRTLGNMLGQSYGLLNNRAANEVFEECHTTGIEDFVYPIGQIHDSQYYIVKDNAEIIYMLCEMLRKAVSWNDLPELQQDTVELSGTPQLSFDSWAELVDVDTNNKTEFLNFYNDCINFKNVLNNMYD